MLFLLIGAISPAGLYKMFISWRLPENNRKDNQLFSNTQEKKSNPFKKSTKLKVECYISETRKKNRCRSDVSDFGNRPYYERHTCRI